jgi:hypothetical protein
VSRKPTAAATAVDSVSLPHSWDFNTWPPSVFPGDGKRGKYLFRMSQRDLLAEGACARVGRCVVFFGAGYSRFLKKHASRVPDFAITANTNRAAAAPAA